MECVRDGAYPAMMSARLAALIAAVFQQPLPPALREYTGSDPGLPSTLTNRGMELFKRSLPRP